MAYPYRYAPDGEVLGAGISAIFNHRRRNEVLDSLVYHGADYLDPETWYPVDKFINIFTEWQTMPDTSTNIISVGMAMIYHLEWPGDTDRLDLTGRLAALGDLHSMYHRGDVGGYATRVESLNHIVYTENTIWPDDMIYGFIYGAAQHFLPDGTRFTLMYDPQAPRQDQGGHSTILHLKW